MLVFVSAMLIVLLSMALFTVDVAYMQLTRSELRSAVDAATKAGAEALRRTKSEADARAAVKLVALKNRVGGQPLIVQDAEIEFGSARLQSDGHWEFRSGETPYTTVRVATQMGGGSANPAVNLFFGRMFGSGTFEPVRSSTAAHTATEIVLCLDRSHSMCFDMSGVDWAYPAGTPMWPHPIVHPPHPAHSRWAKMVDAVQEFNTILNAQNPRPRVSLVTWGSVITLANYEGWLTGLTFPAVNRDEPLTANMGSVLSKLVGRGAKPVLGGTNMSAGLSEAIDVLDDSNLDPLASKIMVLMSDGQWNQGTNPVELAKTAKSKHIIIHTVSLLSAGNQSTLEEIAAITGGKFYPVNDSTELSAAFTEIASQLPVVLIE